jgi:hypothetical protein
MSDASEDLMELEESGFMDTFIATVSESKRKKYRNVPEMVNVLSDDPEFKLRVAMKAIEARDVTIREQKKRIAELEIEIDSLEADDE